jgi:hypothetical protein
MKETLQPEKLSSSIFLQVKKTRLEIAPHGEGALYSSTTTSDFTQPD